MKKFLFISTALGVIPLSALAWDYDAYNWQDINNIVRNGDNAILKNDMWQWEYGIIGLDLTKSRAGIDGQGHTLYGGNVNNSKKFIEWQDNSSSGGNVTLVLRDLTLRDFHDIDAMPDINIAPSAVLNIHSNSNNNVVEMYNVGFYNNYIEFSGYGDRGAEGAAFRNYVTYGQDLYIDGSTFDNNRIKISGASPVTSYAEAHGGAVYIALSQYVDQEVNQNVYMITDTTFSNNSVETNARNAQGGALFVEAEKQDNLPSIDLSGVIFEKNKAVSTSTSLSDSERNAKGGAIMNKGLMSIDDSIFSENTVESSGSAKAAVYGGAIANAGTISSIDASFEENSAYSANNKSYGGAIYNEVGANIGTISGDFDENSTTTEATGANYANAAGGAIANAGSNQGHGTITGIIGNFTGNYAMADSSVGQAQGGAIFNTTGASIGTITGNFDQNEAYGGAKAQGGAIYTNSATINQIFGDFTGNSVSSEVAADGGAMFVQGTTVNVSGDFLNNSATVAEGGTARGGAVLINNNGKLNLTADATSSTDNYKDEIVIQGNYIKVGDETINEAIYTSGGTAMIKPQVNFSSIGGGIFSLYDIINGDGSGSVTFTGDDKGRLNLYNDILGQSQVVFSNTYTIATDDGSTGTTTIENLTTNASQNLILDINLALNTKDEYDYYTGIDKLNFTNNEYYYNLHISDFNILTDMAANVYQKSFLYSTAPDQYVTGASDFYTQSDNYIYHAETDENVATLSKAGKANGYVTYLRNMLDGHKGAIRTYDFEADGIEYINYNGEVVLDNSDLTINGNNATLTQYEGQASRALDLGTNQSATIKKLEITGFTDTAIYNQGTIKQIDNKSTFSYNEGSYGAAIENVGLIKNLNANFSHNSSDVDGGAIDTYGEGAVIESITGTFSHNDALTASGAVGVGTGARIDSITSSLFEYNQALVAAGAIGVQNGASIGYINSWFVENYAGELGGAIGNEGTIGQLYGLFNRNYTDFAGGAIGNVGRINLISADFINNKAGYYGAAITNVKHYESASGSVSGDGIINFLADAEYDDDVLEDDIEFRGNILTEVEGNEGILNAIGGVINFAATNDGSYTFYDAIHGLTDTYDIFGGDDYTGIVNFTSSDGTGVLNLYNDIIGQQQVNVSGFKINTTGDYDASDNVVFNVINIDNLRITSPSSLYIDVDLANERSDSFVLNQDATNYSDMSLDLNILTDMAATQFTLEIPYSNYTISSGGDRAYNSSNYFYMIEDTGSVLTITKAGAANGYVPFLRKERDGDETERTYNFAENGTEYINYDGEVIDSDSVLTINGNNATLTSYNGVSSRALDLRSGQTAEIHDLTINKMSAADDNEGGAIYNYGLITELDNVDFTYNSIEDDDYAHGAAIYNQGRIVSLDGDFSHNGISATNYDVSGGAIYNGEKIDTISGTFSYNTAHSEEGAAYGGAIYNADTIYEINGSFDHNRVTTSSSETGDIAETVGSAIHNVEYIGKINADFTYNNADTGGALTNYGEIGELYGSFENNSAGILAAALGNIGNIYQISADFKNNTANYYGAALANFKDYFGFSGNGVLTFLADAEDDSDLLQDDIEFTGNTVTASGENEAIINAYGGTLNFNATNKGSYTFNDAIHGLTDTYHVFGEDDYTGIVNFASDDNTGVLNLYNDITGQAEVNVSGFTINTSGNVDDNDDPIFDVVNIDNLNIKSESNLSIDVNLGGDFPVSDYITVNGFSKDADFNLSSVNIIGNFDDTQSAVRKIEYTNVDNLTETSYLSITNTSAQYQFQNDGRYLDIYKIGDGLTYEEFLANKNADTIAPRTYVFNEDQTMGSWLDGSSSQGVYNYTASSWVNAPTPIVVEGKNHTLTFVADDTTQALNLAEGQTATIKDLTIKDFQKAVSNSGDLTLTNVTINTDDTVNNNIALENLGTASVQGLNIDGYNFAIGNAGTFSGNNISASNSAQTAIVNEEGTFEATGLTLNKNNDAVLNIGTSMSLSNIDITETTNIALKNTTNMTVNGGNIDGAQNAVYNSGTMSVTGVDISDGGKAVVNFNDLTLNNVVIQNSDVAITSDYGTVTIAGETTLKNNDNDFYGKPVHYDQLETDYPIIAAYYEVFIPAAMGNGDYEEGFNQISAYFSQKAGHEITVTNGAECAEAWAEVAYIEGKTQQNPSELQLLKTDIPGLTEDAYNAALQDLYDVADENPYRTVLVYFAMRSGFASADDYYASLTDEQKATLDTQLSNIEMQLKTSGAPDIRRLFGDVDVGKDIDILMADNAVLNVQSGMDGDDEYSVTFRGSDNSVVKIGSVSDDNIDINMAQLVFDGPASLVFNTNFADNTKAIENKSGTSQIRSVVFTNVDTAVENSGIMEIVDSSFNGGDIAVQNNAAGTLSVENTTIDGTETAINNAGTATLGEQTVIKNAENAIVNSGELTLSGVTVQDSENAIFVEEDGVINIAGENTFANNINEIYGKSGTMTLNFANGTSFDINNGVDGDAAFGLVLKGNTSSAFNVNTDMKKADLVLDGIRLKIDNEETNLATLNSFEAKSGILDLQNGYIRQLMTNNFTVSGAINLLLDVDLENEEMDTLGDLNVLNGGIINVKDMNIISDTEENSVSVAFAKDNYKDKVSTSLQQVSSAQYTYNVVYNADTGEFVFSRGGNVDPADVIENRIAGTATATAQILHSSINMQILERDLHSLVGLSSGDLFNKANPWVKTFGSNDHVDLHNTADNIKAQFYGVIGGVDSKTIRYCNGFKAVYGLYAAYIESNQKFDNNKIHQKGGYIGTSAAFKKDIFFTNFSANAGYLRNEAKTARGKDKFNTKVGSVANKTGVSVKYKGLNITPSVMLSYMAVNTSDYTNKAGVKIDNNMLHVYEVRPELKVSKDLPDGVTLYAKASYVVDYYEGGKIRANSVLLPNISAKPYVEYGVGVEKDWRQCIYCSSYDMTSYANVNRHDGGREGWDVNGGVKLEF